MGSRIFNIEWRTLYVSGGTSAKVNFEVRLFEGDPNLKFEVVYGKSQAGGHSQLCLRRPRRLGHRILHPGLLRCLTPPTARLAHLRNTALRKSVANANAYCDSDAHGNSDGHGIGYAYCNGQTFAYTADSAHTEASSDSAAPTVGLAICDK